MMRERYKDEEWYKLDTCGFGDSPFRREIVPLEDLAFSWDIPNNGALTLVSESTVYDDFEKAKVKLQQVDANFKGDPYFHKDKILEEVAAIEKAMEENPMYTVEDDAVYFGKKLYSDLAREGIYVQWFDPMRFKSFKNIAEAKHMVDGSEIGLSYAQTYHAKQFLLDRYSGEYGGIENLMRWVADAQVDLVDDIWYDEDEWAENPTNPTPYIRLKDCVPEEYRGVLFPHMDELARIKAIDLILPEDEYVASGYPRSFIQKVNSQPHKFERYDRLIDLAYLARYQRGSDKGCDAFERLLEDYKDKWSGDYEE